MLATHNLPPGLYFIALAVDEGRRFICNPVDVHSDGYATCCDVRWTPIWVEAMATHNRLHRTHDDAVAWEQSCERQKRQAQEALYGIAS